VCDELVEAVDLFPGLCEVMGLAIPKTVQGRSLKPLLDEEPRPIRESALTENAYRKTLATKRWRYVANLDGQKDELYDREEDPWELNNRIDDPACAEVVQGLLRDLLRRVVRARKPITSINGGWHRHKYDRDGRIDLEASGGPGHPTYNPYW
jgi:arylsulfatase A-like enzyme